jgi:hemoglobin
MGGPASYSDDALRRVHADLNITHGDFVEAADLLAETLEDFNFEPDDVSYVRRQVMDREPFIVSRKG